MYQKNGLISNVIKLVIILETTVEHGFCGKPEAIAHLPLPLLSRKGTDRLQSGGMSGC